MKKFCTKCGREFEAVGREVICPQCKQAAAEDAKRAAVLKAKRASWTGESVPVRISGRASTVIRECGAVHGLPFAAALDALLRASDFFQTMGKTWEDITPYKSHRRDKHATEDEQDEQDVTSKPQEVKAAGKPQDAPQDVQGEPVKPVKTAAKKAVKTTSKASTPGKASKASKK